MLTRRDQLELKDHQQKEQDEKADDSDKPKPKRKAKAAPKAGSKAKAKAGAKSKSTPDKRAAKTKAKAKAKSKSKPSENMEEADEAMSEVNQDEPMPDASQENKNDEIDAMETPRKRLKPLFDASAEPVPYEDQSPRTQRVLDRIEEALLPKPIRRARQQKKAATDAAAEASAGSSKGNGEKGSGGKGRGRGRGRGRGKKPESPFMKDINKSPLIAKSPAVKKERARRQRKKAQQNPPPQDGNMENTVMVGLFHQLMKNVDGLTYEDLQNHLTNSPSLSGYTRARLSTYWGRKACGVKFVDDPSTPQVAYFAYKHPKASGYNILMSVAYISAALLVPLQLLCLIVLLPMLVCFFIQ